VAAVVPSVDEAADGGDEVLTPVKLRSPSAEPPPVSPRTRPGFVTATAPSKATTGKVSVAVTTPGGSTNGLTYNYAAQPTISAITPAAGSSAGDYTPKITGTNLDTTTQITFGGTAAASFAVVSSTKLVAVTPAHAPGLVNVVVSTLAGTATLIDGYRYT
jgi:hypothetical protein